MPTQSPNVRRARWIPERPRGGYSDRTPGVFRCRSSSDRWTRAIYARVSTDRQQDGASLDVQRDACVRYCETHVAGRRC